MEETREQRWHQREAEASIRPCGIPRPRMLAVRADRRSAFLRGSDPCGRRRVSDPRSSPESCARCRFGLLRASDRTVGTGQRCSQFARPRRWAWSAVLSRETAFCGREVPEGLRSLGIRTPGYILSSVDDGCEDRMYASIRPCGIPRPRMLAVRTNARASGTRRSCSPQLQLSLCRPAGAEDGGYRWSLGVFTSGLCEHRTARWAPVNDARSSYERRLSLHEVCRADVRTPATSYPL